MTIPLIDNRRIKITRCVVDDEYACRFANRGPSLEPSRYSLSQRWCSRLWLVRMYSALLLGSTSASHGRWCCRLAWGLAPSLQPLPPALRALRFVRRPSRIWLRLPLPLQQSRSFLACVPRVSTTSMPPRLAARLVFGTSLLPFVFVGLVFSHALGSSQKHAAGLLRTALAAAACAIVASAFVMCFGPARVGLPLR